MYEKALRLSTGERAKMTTNRSSVECHHWSAILPIFAGLVGLELLERQLHVPFIRREVFESIPHTQRGFQNEGRFLSGRRAFVELSSVVTQLLIDRLLKRIAIWPTKAPPMLMAR